MSFQKQLAVGFLIALVVVIFAFFMQSALASEPSREELSKIHGRIQYVDSFPDYKVQVVDAFPDLKVQIVNAFPDGAGKWQIVDSFPDFKIQKVSAFPDFKIQYVKSFPGVAQ